MYLTDAIPAPGFWSAIEHGRQHHGDDQQRMREWQRLKGQGVKVGLSDIFIWYERQFIAIELKVGSQVSDPQRAFCHAMKQNDFSWHVVRSVEALDAILRATIPILPSLRIAALHHDAELSKPEPAKKKGTYRRPAAKPKATSAALRASRQMYGLS